MLSKFPTAINSDGASTMDIPRNQMTILNQTGEFIGSNMDSSFAHLRTIANRDGAAILDVSHNQITTLNATGSFVWTHLVEGKTVEETIQDLADASNTDPKVVEQGVRAFIRQLQLQHLIP